MGNPSPPLAVITPDDHRGYVHIANAFGLCLILLFTLIRVSVRLLISPPFQYDDILLFTSTGFGIIYSALVFTTVDRGYGMAQDLISPGHLISLQKAAFASDLFLLVTLWCSKCSMAALFIRLTPRKEQQKILKGLLVAISVWLVFSLLFVALRCNLGHPWIFIDTKCHDLTLRWQIISAFDIVIEVALFSMSILLVKDLKLATRKKVSVVIAFGLRLPMIAFTILRLHALNVQTGSSNPTLAGTFLLIWSVVEADFSICSGNIACLKPFMAAFNTSYGGSSEVHALSQAGGSGGESGVLSTLGSMRFGRRKKNKDDGSGLRSGTKHSQQLSSRDSMDRTNNLGNDAEIIHEDGGSIESQGSRQMIIQKDVTFDVQYNPRDVGKAVTAGTRGSYNNNL